MNNEFEDEIRYRLLKILSREQTLTQRKMAGRVGVSLGKVNYCLSELGKAGLIKVHRFKSARNKIPYTYILTPRGLQEKVRLTKKFLERKVAEYEEIERRIEELARELGEEEAPGVYQRALEALSRKSRLPAAAGRSREDEDALSEG